jgi:hypothetical protein
MIEVDGDEPLQLLVVGEIDKAETALTENLFDAVTTDVLQLRGGNGWVGGLVVAARLIIIGSFGVVHGSPTSSASKDRRTR